MRILQVHPFLRGDRLNPGAGGKSRASLQLTRFLMSRNIDTTIFPYPERIFGGVVLYGVAPGETARVFPTMGFPAAKNAFSLWNKNKKSSLPRVGFRNDVWNLLSLVGIRNALAEFQPDLVHLHMSHSCFPDQFRIAGGSVPLLMTHHTGERSKEFAACDFVACISKAFQDSLVSETKYPREKTRVIYCPISSVFYEQPPLPNSSRKGIVFIGGAKAEKGLDLLLEAFALEPRLRMQPLHICGTGDEETKFQESAKAGQLPVVFHGRVDARQVRDLVGKALLTVIPSRAEGFSIALLESLACGTPVVGWAPQVKELQEMWNMPVGVPFDARNQDARALADAILAALDAPAQQDSVRMRLAENARGTFSLERYGESYLALYRELLAR